LAPGVAEVEHICALSEPVLRNLQITQCYHELSAGLQARLQPGANWCTFATWASKQAGQTIRKEDLERALKRVVQQSTSAALAAQQLDSQAQALFPAQLNRAAPGLRLASPQERSEFMRAIAVEALDIPNAAEHASQAVSRGNLKVFAEIGREFSRFIAERLGDAAYDPQKIAAFNRGLLPGEPPDGQDFLRQAFSHYYAAIFEVDPAKRAELTLLANLEIGFHEQTRLQPEIRDAIEAPLAGILGFAGYLLGRLFPSGGWRVLARWLWLRLRGRSSELETAILTLYDTAQTQARRALSALLMSIALPGSVVRLGDDLSLGFPESLCELSNPDLLQLLEQIDPTPNSPRDSGALDWADLPERLHFIADLFRCYHEDVSLLSAPFTPAQIKALKAGRMPQGEL
jgi:hypothetical protein